MRGAIGFLPVLKHPWNFQWVLTLASPTASKHSVGVQVGNCP